MHPVPELPGGFRSVPASRSISCDIDGKTVTVEYDDAKTKPQAHFHRGLKFRSARRAMIWWEHFCNFLWIELLISIFVGDLPTFARYINTFDSCHGNGNDGNDGNDAISDLISTVLAMYLYGRLQLERVLWIANFRLHCALVFQIKYDSAGHVGQDEEVGRCGSERARPMPWIDSKNAKSMQ